MVRRSGFTFIELIFAIVIIAITVLTLPVMSRITSKGVENSIVQEAIFAAATELNDVTTHHWDANSIEGNNPLARVINPTNCDYNTSSVRYGLMPGHVRAKKHRRCLDNNTTLPALSSSTSVDTIENKAHGYQLIFLNPTADKEGYKDKYTSELKIKYNAKFGLKKDKNIKKITVTIHDSKRHVLTSLRTYVFNIGEPDYMKRSY